MITRPIASILLLFMPLAAASGMGSDSTNATPGDSSRSATHYFSGGRIDIICSSHQDIAWMDSPWKCMVQRDTQVITPALKLMREHPDYCYGMESMMNLMEYLERHPERRDEVYQRTKEGRFEWGATYNQPYESLLSGEQLVRELYFGRKWIKKNFPGCDARVAWNPDVPGRSLQAQQILAKAGVPFLMISRQKKSIFRWISPDGSSVLAFTPGHYYNSSQILDRPGLTADSLIQVELQQWGGYYSQRGIAPLLPMLYSQDALGPKYFDTLIRRWNKNAAHQALPLMEHSTAERFFADTDKHAAKFDTMAGERPNVWLYIHGPTHHWAISSKREAAVLLPAAETFNTVEALLDGSYARYPAKELARAWAASIYDDHGWGGNQGQITDQLFRSKLDSARDAGRELLGQALGQISSRIRYPHGGGTPVVVFNALSWQRTDPVICLIAFDSPDIRVTDAEGWPVPSQILPPEPGQPLATKKVMFIARDVPSLGYKTYFVLPRKQTGKREAPSRQAADQVIENKFYRITLAPGGIKSIVDKELKKELLTNKKFLGAELFTMSSVGNGAGEFGQTQQPTMEGFDKLSLHKPPWRQCESGPVFTAFQLDQPLSTCTLRQKLVVYQDMKRIDMDVSILGWSGAPYREFRMALPLNLDKGTVSYEVPMGVVTVGKDEMPGAAGLAYGSVNYSQPCSEAHPREVQNFVSANDGQFGVTMSSSVAVCDFMDPTSDPVAYPVLQPVLLASRKSCHGLGNWYLQEGDHHYRFSIFSHASGWHNGYRQAIQANNHLIPVVRPTVGEDAKLPMEKSFFSIDNPNVILSTMKKCDDDDQIIVRCYEMEGRDKFAMLRLPAPIMRAESTNIIEEEGKVIPSGTSNVRAKFGHHAIETFKIFPAIPLRAQAENK